MSSNGDRWLLEEIDIIRNDYQIIGPKKLKKFLPNRSLFAIRSKAERLGLRKRKKRNEWTIGEMDFVKNEYQNLGPTKISKVIPHHRADINKKAKEMGIKILPENRGNKFNLKVIQSLSELEKSYFSGFVDGEGCIHIAKSIPPHCTNPRYQLTVSVSNTNKNIIEKFHKIFGGCINLNKPKTKRKRICYRWTVVSNLAKIFLEIIYPYLFVKKEEARLALEFQNNRKLFGRNLSKEIIDIKDWYTK